MTTIIYCQRKCYTDGQHMSTTRPMLHLHYEGPKVQCVFSEDGQPIAYVAKSGPEDDEAFRTELRNAILLGPKTFQTYAEELMKRVSNGYRALVMFRNHAWLLTRVAESGVIRQLDPENPIPYFTGTGGTVASILHHVHDVPLDQIMEQVALYDYFTNQITYVVSQSDLQPYQEQ